MTRNKNTDFDKISVSVNGKKTKFKIGDHIKFNESDVLRCITAISVDSDGCVTYQLSFLNDKVLTSQYMSENDFLIMESMNQKPKVIGFK